MSSTAGELNEKNLVEERFIKELTGLGWTHKEAHNTGRDSLEEPLIIPSLFDAIKRINSDKNLSQEDINKVINILKSTPTGPEGARQTLFYIKNGITIRTEKREEVKVALIDYENPGNNEFMVSNQMWFKGREKVRTDIMLYVNGIPLVNIECKNPANPAESWYNAYKQIKRYEREVPELYKYVQIGVAAEAEVMYFPIVPWQEDVKIYRWRSTNTTNSAKINGGAHSFADPILETVEMLSPDVLLDLIKNFVFYKIEGSETTKVIARYMQYRAANKIVKRVLDNIRGKTHKDRGLIWHWQGSGKTLTMIFAAHKLFYSPEMEHPTIFFVVDRTELEKQLSEELNKIDLGFKGEKVSSIRALKEVIEADDYSGKRGVFITLIHKFDPKEFAELEKEIEKRSQLNETIATRKNVVAFIDEGHRTQYGILAYQMKNILRNAFFFAFTGTPISKKGRDSFLKFAYPPDELYLDKYFITDSIRDGFTVKIAYQPRLENLHIKKEDLEDFLESELDEIPDEDQREEVEERIKNRLNYIKVFLENPERIKAIAKDIAEHFSKNIDGKFKAMVVAASRKACDLYKKELDKLLPKNYSAIVMTYSQNDEEALKGRLEETKSVYGDRDQKELKDIIVSRFKYEELPKILIVTDMLLTGFDAPILQVMYLDKPLKEHRLLQAVARTNRPYRGVKEAGLVIDYVGVLKELKKALKMYSEEDIAGALVNTESLQKEYENLIEKIFSTFDEKVKENWNLTDDKKVPPARFSEDYYREILEILTSDPALAKMFERDYRNLRRLFEFLISVEEKIKNTEDYLWLSKLYNHYIKLTRKEDPEVLRLTEKYFKKTLEKIHEAQEIKEIKTDLPVAILDEEYLEKLKEVKDVREKAANILFALNRFVLVDKSTGALTQSLAEKVEKLLQMWQKKNKNYEAIYTEGLKIVKDIHKLLKRQSELNMDTMEYSMLLSVEKRVGRKKELVNKIKEFSERLKEKMLPGWMTNPVLRKEVEREIRRFSRKIKSEYGLNYEEMDKLYQEMLEAIENYGND